MSLLTGTLLVGLMAIIVIALVTFQHWRWFDPDAQEKSES